jgi:hypothetical protein
MKLARRWLEHDVIPSLEWYRRFLAGQKKTQIADFRPDVRESLSRHFRITDPQSQEATQLLENLKAMSALLGSGEFRCSAPAGCGGRDAEFDVQGGAVTLCPPFFEQSDERRRARTLVHELAHAKATTDGTQDTRARDLAYPTHRAYTEMSSRQLLNNAESYAAFVHDIATKTVERPREARDTVSQCRVPPFPANSVQLIRGALAIGELWNADAMSATSVRRKSDVELVNRVRARFFDRPIPTLEQMLMHVYFEAKNAFRRDLRFECSTDCESGVVGYYKNFLFIEGSTLYLCPSWFARPTPQARAASLYELVLRRYAGASEVDARRFVGFARAVGPLVTGEPSR